MDFYQPVGYQTDVSLNITAHLFTKPEFQNQNIVFSPLSLFTVLSIIAVGSEGPAKQQLLSFLQANSTDHLNSFSSQLISSTLSDASRFGGPRLSFVNGLWVERSLSLQPSFKKTLTTYYKANLASADFLTKAGEVIEEVNLWGNKRTNGLIKTMVPRGSVNDETKLIFANALYFKGTWDEKFDAWKTREYDFHIYNGNSVKVPFITSTKDQFISVFDGFKVLGLPYKQGNGLISGFDTFRKLLSLPYKQDKDKRRFSMYFFLPDTKDGLPLLIKKLASESKFLDDKFPNKKVEVGHFRIPKFKISFELETSDVLKELGVDLPFYPGSLTKMVDSHMDKHLSVSKIFHKSFIEVKEEGTEAAAITFGVVSNGCSLKAFIPPQIDFVADHPFLFLIREDFSEQILFIGQVFNPLDG
ncbi:unnamed protein product [Trifolium pratense]|uniref:Uncharacterized protein n=1 Tax=Trifolium pratense TaxID=57577 RepID=A0ACB0J7U3_TRIPR|nr:unnamed protein product [Trifolium pratense]